LALALVGVVAVCYALYFREALQIEYNNLDLENRRTDRFGSLFKTDVSSVVGDLRLLGAGDGLTSYLATGTPADLERAIRRAVYFSKDNPDYDQLRYIDEKGQEVFRVNRNGDVVPPNQLQNKADRPYFQKANALAPGEIFVSTLDLNVEHGQIERPYKPMLRLALPVFDATGRRRGIYIINYLAGNSLDRIRQYSPRFAQRFRVLNDRGYWLAGARPEDEWGFVLPERADRSLARTDPELWARILREPAGQAPYHGGYFTWSRVIPTQFASNKPVKLVAEDPFIVFASELGPEEWAATLLDLRQDFIVVAWLLGVLTICLAWFFQARQRAQKERDRFFTLTRDMLSIAGFDGRFKRVNPAWEESLGYTQEELLSRPFLDFVHPDDHDKTILETSRLALGEEVHSFENRYRCKDGTYRWLLWSARPMIEHGLIYASARDVTARREAAERIQKLNEDLKARAEQLEGANQELESFSYSVSHDLRAPLRHIHGFVDLLQRAPEFKANETAQRQMGVIARAAKEMGRLIDDLLAFSRTGRAEMHLLPVNMRDLAEQSIQALENETQGRRVTWDLQPLPIVEGDPALLRQVWANLLGNAVKYTRPCAEARIEIGRKKPAGPDAEKEAVFYVRDNGVGFDMRYATKLFGVFQRLHRAEDFEGTGIGLANVQRIVHRHGGKVWADSVVGGGSTFYFSLPIQSARSLPREGHDKN
jgi:PAS domain S-box-containing protein